MRRSFGRSGLAAGGCCSTSAPASWRSSRDPCGYGSGITDRRPVVHRRLGTIYLAAVGVSSVAAFYLAFHTDLGVVFGSGLTGLAIAWLVTSGLAYTAIRRHLYEQHKEWMIRSYVVTTAFVTFRVLFLVLEAAGVGTLNERLTIASWFCWAIPLLATEAWLQGKKILAVRAG